MASSQLDPLLRFVRSLGADRESSDQELLDCFLANRSESAFRALVQGHGPMVYAVCRRVLRDRHRAEDAFRATVLVLVRKARSLADRTLLGNWLWGVAYRTAIRARAEAARHASRPMPVVAASEAREPEADWRALLDAELARLPEKYRAPLVLCYLEGKTHAEAAEALRWPIGTVKGRLARGRDRLRVCLARRGVAPAALGSEVASSGLRAAVPNQLVQVTAAAALGLVSGTAVASPTVIALVEGVVQTMWLSKLKIAIASVLVIGLIGMGVTYRVLAASGTDHTKEPPRPARALVQEPASQPRAEKANASGGESDGLTVESFPASVVHTMPESGARDVDAAAVTEIRVTFSKKMRDKSWSWSLATTNDPISDRPHYEPDQRTCVAPVKLKPGQTYAFWINSEKYGNFRDLAGRSAVPYLLVFQTKGSVGRGPDAIHVAGIEIEPSNLMDVLEYLSQRFSVAIELDQEAFKRAGNAHIERAVVKLPLMQNVTLGKALDALLYRVSGTYEIRDGKIVVIPKKRG